LSHRNINKLFSPARPWTYHSVSPDSINPLTPELDPSAQRCLPRFFTGDFNF
jgi:hypothetical protein